MPCYRVRRFSNARAEKRFTFSANSDEEALRAIPGFDWSRVGPWSYEAADLDDEDVLFDIERLGAIQNDDEIVAEGIRDPASFPYTWEAVALVQAIAGLAAEGGYNCALDTLDNLIQEALRLVRDPAALEVVDVTD